MKNKPAKKKVAKKKTGRPSSYREEYKTQAYKLCQLGATDVEMASFFGVALSTFNLWKLKHPSFSEALKESKAQADANVVKSLYQRATGYSHPEDKIFNANGNEMIVPTTKHYPPDTTAAIFWLKNRQKGDWRDKQEQEISGPNGGPVENKWTVEIVHTDAKATDSK